MSIISIIAFIVAAHSVFMIVKILLKPHLYEIEATFAGVTPSVTVAITTKVILACAAAGVGFYFM